MAFLVKLIGRIIAAVRGPGGRTVWSALWAGFRTYRAALAVGLVVGWTACVAAEAFAAFFAVESALATFFAVTEALAASIVPGVYGSGVGGSITIVSALAGGLVGSVGAFLVLVVDTILLEPQQVVAELITGTIIALVITMAIYRVEPWMLERFGYRRMAWDERERLTPLITDAATALGIDHAALPSIVIVDTVDTRAWATMRAVVLTRGLIEVLDDEELAGILAHEFAHWQAGHPVGERLLWAAALPLVLAQAVAQWFSGWRSGLVRVVAWLVFWPVNLTIRFVIAPLHGRYSRAYEYDADAAAAAAGVLYREGLRRALTKLSIIEAPRSGWEAALIRSHPPTALRVERLVSLQEAARRADVVTAWVIDQARRQAGQTNP
jgi:Zn-dependent protease with chaperone function